MINVLICDDSYTSTELLSHILNSDPEIKVIGIVHNGDAAVSAASKLEPDLILMDVHMPGINGFEATQRILYMMPVPIIIMSRTLDDYDSGTRMAIDAGALAFIQQPPGPAHPDYQEIVDELIRLVKMMAEVKVVKRKQIRNNPSVAIKPGQYTKSIPQIDLKLIAIGASTGGPVVLQYLLTVISQKLNVPLLIVQHIAHGFVNSFTDWLSQTCNLPMHVASNGEAALPGHGYIAPDEHHMGIDKKGVIKLSNEGPINGLRPSVSYLFSSVADSYGPNAAGILLTGMGRDGAMELKLLRDKGALTIAQDEASSIVHGMPGEAIKMNAAQMILSPQDIAIMLARLLDKHN